tara:strand:- start:18515 stop:19303 length:789 start_codon:yes stop_codon:yes gene_type:complete
MALYPDLLLSDALIDADSISDDSPFAAALIDTPIQVKETIDDADTTPFPEDLTRSKLRSVRSLPGLDINECPSYFVSRHFAKSFQVLTTWSAGGLSISIDQAALVGNSYTTVNGVGTVTGDQARPTSFSDRLKGSRVWTAEGDAPNLQRAAEVEYAIGDTRFDVRNLDGDELVVSAIQFQIYKNPLYYHADTGVFSANDISLLASIETDDGGEQGGVGAFGRQSYATNLGIFCGMDVAIEEDLGIAGSFDVTFSEFLPWDDV